MELDRVEQLLEKYFDGATNITEEQELKNYFSSSAVAPHLEKYQSMFGYFAQAKEEKLTSRIILKNKKPNYIAWLSVAASVIIMLGVSFYVYNNSFSTSEEDYGTFDNPELAFKETQKALNMISNHVNTGIESMNYINEYEQTKNKVFK